MSALLHDTRKEGGLLHNTRKEGGATTRHKEGGGGYYTIQGRRGGAGRNAGHGEVGQRRVWRGIIIIKAEPPQEPTAHPPTEEPTAHLPTSTRAYCPHSAHPPTPMHIEQHVRQEKARHQPVTWALDSPRPGPYGQTSAGGWEPVANQPVPSLPFIPFYRPVTLFGVMVFY